MAPTQQAHSYESAGDNAPRADEKSHMSKAVAREMNRLKTQEGQMIKVSSRPSHLACLIATCGVLMESMLTFRRL